MLRLHRVFGGFAFGLDGQSGYRNSDTAGEVGEFGKSEMRLSFTFIDCLDGLWIFGYSFQERERDILPSSLLPSASGFYTHSED